ncbi:MAG: hypothetical protein M0Q38_06110 [Bacteroidales bacterium]|jgi:hypothetical protein|nr:hypothetical protein [Bacteroidales bacterium]
MDNKTLEKYSSAFTLSDMEIFIFPELLYALVLADIMSPEIWKWRDDPWFAGIKKMGPLKKIHRVKQYIMDHYNFNLDLETWGLTDKQTEINRFSDFIDIDLLSRSNALFGYEGDKYYFDIDIRRHFGLDKFDSDIIPYWKTETVEAMNAFRYKPNHEVGAGECVSLACLYAAALFIVAEVPLERIFLMGTPLHSQNFIMVDEGVLTNNRRIVTKNMWYNGTELSALARRALEHEQVTYVAHNSGWIHAMYPEATIDPSAYQTFREKLGKYLETLVDFEIFMNFLRDYSRHQKLFQICLPCQGSTKYIRLEKAFGYEHGSKNRLSDKTNRELFCEMDEEDLHLQPLDHRFRVDPEDPQFSSKPFPAFIEMLKKSFPALENHTGFITDLKKFVHTVPKLPSGNKTYITASELVSWRAGELTSSRAHQLTSSPSHHLTISTAASREEIIQYLSSIRHPASSIQHPISCIQHPASIIADLAFYAGRFMDSCDWNPFFKAAFERNPVSIEYFHELDLPAVYQQLLSWPGESLYEGNRLALPDEVVNYQRGDGMEKSITLVNIARSRHLQVSIRQNGEKIQILQGNNKFEFISGKKLTIPAILLT